MEATFTVSEVADSAGGGLQWAGTAVVAVLVVLSLLLVWRSRRPGRGGVVAASQPF